jgi:hypothetical protein
MVPQYRQEKILAASTTSSGRSGCKTFALYMGHSRRWPTRETPSSVSVFVHRDNDIVGH